MGRNRLSIQLLYSHRLEAIGTLASGVAHDFNNVLTAILGYTEILESRLTDTTSAKHPLDGIRRVSRQASAFSKALLAFTSESSPEKSTLDLTAVAQSTVKWLRRVLPASVELEAEFPRDPLWANVDATRFQQVIVSLALTARDAVPEGGTIHVRLDHKPPSRLDGQNGSRHETALLSVFDGRPGAWCDPRPATPRKDEADLGLSIIRGIIHDHDGQVDVTSENGVRIGITVTLPMCAPPEQPVENGGPAPVAATGSGETLILAEDNRQVRAILSSVLESAGYTVIQASNGIDAMSALEPIASKVRLVVLDADLPQRSGMSCLREMRSQSPRLKAIMISGLTDVAASVSDLEDVVSLGKPFDVAELTHIVGRSLERNLPDKEEPYANNYGSAGRRSCAGSRICRRAPRQR